MIAALLDFKLMNLSFKENLSYLIKIGDDHIARYTQVVIFVCGIYIAYGLIYVVDIAVSLSEYGV